MAHPVALTSLLLASAAVINCSSPTTPSASATDPGTVNSASLRSTTDVSRLDSAEVQAFLANDPAALARLWSTDFVVTNPFNQFVTTAQVLALVTSGTLAFSAYERHIDYTHAYGDIVIVAGRETVVWAGKMPLAGQTSQLRYTAVWARHGDTWQEVARHANMVLPGGQVPAP